MIRKIEKTINENLMSGGIRSILAAVSGGADSIAMLTALHMLKDKFGFTLNVLHVNHCIRGGEANADADFTRNYCGEIQVPCKIVNIDVPAAARASGESLEMAARSARYAALTAYARELNADAVSTGHNADDQLETFFMRLGRGSGTRGLGGIRPRAVLPSGITVIRPLIACRRAEIREWLRSSDISWAEDGTNGDLEITRNRVRALLVPLFEKTLGDSAAESLLRTMEILREDEEWLDEGTAGDLKTCIDDDGALICAGLPPQRPRCRRIILAWLHDNGLPLEVQSSRLVGEIADAAAGPENGSRRIQAGLGIEIIREYGRIRFASKGIEKPAAGLAEGILVTLPHGHGGVSAVSSPDGKITVEASASSGIIRPPRSLPRQFPQECSLSAEKLAQENSLILRTVKPGDAMIPYGVPGRMKLSDILINLKVPRALRPAIAVLAKQDGSVIWLPGYAVDAGYAVSSADAESFRIRISSCNGEQTK